MNYKVIWVCEYCGDVVERKPHEIVPAPQRQGCKQGAGGFHKHKPVQVKEVS